MATDKPGGIEIPQVTSGLGILKDKARPQSLIGGLALSDTKPVIEKPKMNASDVLNGIKDGKFQLTQENANETYEAVRRAGIAINDHPEHPLYEAFKKIEKLAKGE